MQAQQFLLILIHLDRAHNLKNVASANREMMARAERSGGSEPGFQKGKKFLVERKIFPGIVKLFPENRIGEIGQLARAFRKVFACHHPQNDPSERDFPLLSH
ncbi:hypothetical protein [Novosphingobium sp. Gsoil 351]|uniref:hypothetical protein n=1 Tax=Novosphingobium sp. Gsoil 351 TaxID=2675225 RepID=UPI0012B4B810|nr:hypothetical protein [Novosphingobium sp. Gsoil 351]QGN54608.1 hypothetical protein GKE62_08610 [Novosphingobium sp. Gsoil 351]